MSKPTDRSTFRIVLIGDIHVYQNWVWPWQLLNKRVLAFANHRLNRKRRFDIRLLDEVAECAGALDPDCFLFSGDLTGSSLRNEFGIAAGAINRLNRDGRIVAIVPGNHDRYVLSMSRRKTFERGLGALAPSSFPDVRQLTDNWWLAAIDSAVPRFVSSRGRIGRLQLQSLREQLSALPETTGIVMLCHYPFDLPPDRRAGWVHRLADRDDLRQLIADLAPRPILFLHGHVHQPWQWRPNTPELAHVTIINAGSPTQCNERNPRGQGFWQIDLPKVATHEIQSVHHEPESSNVERRTSNVQDSKVESQES